MRICLKAMREKRNLNQQELAERSGIPQPIISQIETGLVKAPRIDTMMKLAKGLKCTVDDLVDEGGAERRE